MKTLIRNILIGMIFSQTALSEAAASLLPMKDKLTFAKIALRDHIEGQGLELINIDIKTPLLNGDVFDRVVDQVSRLYRGPEKASWDYVRFNARDLSTEKIYQGYVYLQSQNISNLTDEEIKAEWANAGYSQSYTQVIENSQRQKVWLFLSDNTHGLKPMPRFGDNDLHLVEMDFSKPALNLLK